MPFGNGSGDQNYASQLTELARQLNTFANSLKSQRSGDLKSPKTLHEVAAEYSAHISDDFPDVLFDALELDWLQS